MRILFKSESVYFFTDNNENKNTNKNESEARGLFFIRIQLKCVWRNIEFGNNRSWVQLLIHRISILHFSHRNKNTTKCKDEVHNSRWNGIVDRWEEEWRSGWNTPPWNSIVEDQRSTNDDHRFDCSRKNVCKYFHSSSLSMDRRETNHRSGKEDCSRLVKHRIDKSSGRKDSSREDELLNEEQTAMMMFQSNQSNEDWREDHVRGNHSSSKWHFAESSEAVGTKDHEE